MTKVFWDGPRVGTGRDSPRGVGNLQLCTNLPEVLRFQGVEFFKHILAACFSHLQFKLKPNLQPAQLNNFPFLSQHKLQVALAAIHAPARSKFAGQEDPGHCRCSRCHRLDAGKSSDKRGNGWQRGWDFRRFIEKDPVPSLSVIQNNTKAESETNYIELSSLVVEIRASLWFVHLHEFMRFSI